MRSIKIVAPVLIISFLAVMLVLPAYRAHHRYHGDQKAQAIWLWSSVQELQNRGSPPADFAKGLDPDVWVSHGFLVFSNGWASFTFHTIHDSEDIGDIALLRTSDGIFYVSYFHFCVGEAEFSSQRHPKDIAEFLELFGARHGWKRGPGA